MSLSAQAEIKLQELELALKQQDLWVSQAPSAAALASSAPFACDTMPFEQWLQFMFIPRMRLMIASNQPLPTSIALLPMGEYVYTNQQHLVELLAVLGAIDELLSGQSAAPGESS